MQNAWLLRTLFFVFVGIPTFICVPRLFKRLDENSIDRRAARDAKRYIDNQKQAEVAIEAIQSAAERIDDRIALNADVIDLFEALIDMDAGTNDASPHLGERQFIYMEYRAEHEQFKKKIAEINEYMQMIGQVPVGPGRIQNTLLGFELFFSEESIRLQGLADRIVPFLDERMKKTFFEYSLKRANDALKLIKRTLDPASNSR